MLAYLSVKGFAIIDQLKVEFKDGFNVITGETGAGKSIIINALSTLMSSRVTADVVRSGVGQAEVTGQFFFGADEYILKRIIAGSGRSRAFANDEPVTLARLETLGSDLISIYGQNEFQHLLDKDNYGNIIDSLLRLAGQRETLAEKVDRLRGVAAELDRRKRESEGREKEMELLTFQIDEIEKKGVEAGEEEMIRERLKVLRNAEKIRIALNEMAVGLHDGDRSAQAIFKDCLGMLRPFGSIDSLERVRTRLESVSFDLEEIGHDLREIEKTLPFDHEEMERLEDRLTDIFKLKEKYGKTSEEIDAFMVSARARLAYLEALSDDITELERARQGLESEVHNLAETLSAKRREGVTVLEANIANELSFLSMKGISFRIMISDKGYIDRDGKDDVELLISTNPGEPPKPLRKIASGGELSRIMLAIKKVIGGDDLKTLIFDEVDAGIGGKIADMVGKRLHDLAGKHQIICITHLPQIAAYADHHFLVEKASTNDKTETAIRELSSTDRVREIARMMAGEVITEKTVERAKEMLHHD